MRNDDPWQKPQNYAEEYRRDTYDNYDQDSDDLNFPYIENPAPISIRRKSIYKDLQYFFLYLVSITFLVSALSLVFTGHHFPFYESTGSLVFFIITGLPLILIFSYMDYRDGSPGKKFYHLQVVYRSHTFWNAFIRNYCKFLPFTINRILLVLSTDVARPNLTLLMVVATFQIVSIIVPLLMINMRQDQRHYGDILAGTQVLPKLEEIIE